MIGRPFEDQQPGATGQRSSQHAEITQIEDRLMLSIERMEMR